MSRFTLLLLLLSPFMASAAEPVQGKLVGLALLNRNATLSLPTDVPQEFRISGKYTSGARTERIHSVEGKSKGRRTGAFVPLPGQPLQGISDAQWMADGTVWTITDNGFGAKTNSRDAMLSLTRLRPNFARGTVARVETLYLRDPDRVLPLEHAVQSKEGWLSGADLDPESFRFAGDRLWIGDEFGPYVLEFTTDGRAIAAHPAVRDGQRICAPDTTASDCAIAIGRSKGFEGLAVSRGGHTLYAMLEAPLPGDHNLTILEFDLRQRRWTGRHWSYTPLRKGSAVGALTWSADHELLLIERDDGEGLLVPPCPPEAPDAVCFRDPALHKQLVRVRLTAQGRAEPLRTMDLLHVSNPRRLGGLGTEYAMPFWTIETVTRVGRSQVLIANDNNFPFSASRHPNRQDDTEFALIEARELFR